MRILFVTNRYPTPTAPGDSPVIAHQRRALEARGHQVDLVYVNSRRSKLAYVNGAVQVARRAGLGPRGYDVVHAHYGSWCGWVARMQHRAKVVVTFRGSDVLRPSERRVSLALAPRLDAVVVMTEEMKQSLGRPDALVLPYGIDPEVFFPADRRAARDMLGLAPDTPLVLFPYDPARPEKRFDIVSAALDLVREELPETEIVTVHGSPQDRVAAYMNACDAMILTSDTEGSPVAVREALACGLPVVSVDVGDVAEVLAEDRSGGIVERDPRSVADGLLAVLRSPHRIDGRAAGERFSTGRGAEQLESLYRRICGVSSLPAGAEPTPTAADGRDHSP